MPLILYGRFQETYQKKVAERYQGETLDGAYFGDSSKYSAIFGLPDFCFRNLVSRYHKGKDRTVFTVLVSFLKVTENVRKIRTRSDERKFLTTLIFELAFRLVDKKSFKRSMEKREFVQLHEQSQKDSSKHFA